MLNTIILCLDIVLVFVNIHFMNRELRRGDTFFAVLYGLGALAWLGCAILRLTLF